MLERLNFLVVYVGSAAAVALLAVCLTSARIGSFDCNEVGADGCDFAAALVVASAPEAGSKPQHPTADQVMREFVATAARE